MSFEIFLYTFGHDICFFSNAAYMPVPISMDPRYLNIPLRGPTDMTQPHYRKGRNVKVGDRVRRGPDWQHGNQDGGLRGIGAVTQILATGANIHWDGGCKNKILIVNNLVWILREFQKNRFSTCKIYKESMRLYCKNDKIQVCQVLCHLCIWYGNSFWFLPLTFRI